MDLLGVLHSSNLRCERSSDVPTDLPFIWTSWYNHQRYWLILMQQYFGNKSKLWNMTRVNFEKFHSLCALAFTVCLNGVLGELNLLVSQ